MDLPKCCLLPAPYCKIFSNIWWIIQQIPPPCVSCVGHQSHRSSVTDNMALPHEECVFINGISNFAAGHEAFCCVHPNKEIPNQKTTLRIVNILEKQVVSVTGNALVPWQFEYTYDTHCWNRLTRSQRKYLRILSWENDQLKQFVTKQIDNYTQDLLIPLSTSATSLYYSWKNSLLPLVSWFFAWGVYSLDYCIFTAKRGCT